MYEDIYEELKANDPRNVISSLFSLEVTELQLVKHEGQNLGLHMVSHDIEHTNESDNLEIG